MHLQRIGTELLPPTSDVRRPNVKPPQIIEKRGRKCYLNKDMVPTNRGGFLTFAAEWCGWCQRLAPEMEQARQKYGFTSYFMDGDKPETSKYMELLECSGFPSVYEMLPSGELKKYEGERTSDDLGKTFLKNSRVSGGGDSDSDSDSDSDDDTPVGYFNFFAIKLKK